MESSYLFSIGHGNKSIAEFIAELAQFDIQYLIDIRSKPYSKFYPWFNHYELKHAISETHQITYAYMDDVLGGLPKEDCGCYTDGQATLQHHRRLHHTVIQSHTSIFRALLLNGVCRKGPCSRPQCGLLGGRQRPHEGRQLLSR